jgi:hypothetical protein
MPTSSQSQILSVVDYQLLHQQQQQQQQTAGQDGTTKLPVRISVNQTSVSTSKRRHQNQDHHPSVENKNDDDDNDDQSPPPPSSTARRRSSGKLTDGKILKKKQVLRLLLHKYNVYFFQHD